MESWRIGAMVWHLVQVEKHQRAPTTLGVSLTQGKEHMTRQQAIALGREGTLEQILHVAKARCSPKASRVRRARGGLGLSPTSRCWGCASATWPPSRRHRSAGSSGSAATQAGRRGLCVACPGPVQEPAQKALKAPKATKAPKAGLRGWVGRNAWWEEGFHGGARRRWLTASRELPLGSCHCLVWAVRRDARQRWRPV